jgi:hypothetical protein
VEGSGDRDTNLSLYRGGMEISSSHIKRGRVIFGISLICVRIGGREKDVWGGSVL